MKRGSFLVGLIFLIVGLADFIGVVISLKYFDGKNGRQHLLTDGKITHFREEVTRRNGKTSSSYFAQVEFRDQNNNLVQAEENVFLAKFFLDELQTVPIHFDPQNPTRAGINIFWVKYIFQIFISIIGLPFFILGVIFTKRAWEFRQLKARLQAKGKKISAKVLGLKIDSSYQVNQRSPWVLECSAVDPRGKKWVFESEHLWHDPISLGQVKIGDDIVVLVVPHNYGLYVVDMAKFKVN